MTIAKTTALASLAAAALMAVSAPERAAAQTEQAWMKDLHVEQLPIAQLQPAPAAAAAGGAAAADELTVHAEVDRADGLYEQGDLLTLTVVTSEDAFVWVFDTGTSGKVHQLFPNRYDGDNFVRGGAQRRVPESGAEYELVVSHPPGAELITVVASTENALPTEELIDSGTAAGPFYAMLGDAASLAKDLHLSLSRSEAPAAVAHRVVHVR